jgi:energy-coupling factor transporter ATP-binding protein EcfA2
MDKRSLLIYGNNGSGKSSITDAIEWFYNNWVVHLSGEEIGRGGIDALRSIFLKKEDTALVGVEFTNEDFNSDKALFYKKDYLQSEQSNQSEEFKEYLKDSQKENLILRYKDLVNFILASKKEKLDSLSDIIGFSEVSKVRFILRKMVGELKRDFKRGDFDNKINMQQQKLIEYFDRNVTSDEQFIGALNELLKPLVINRKINNTGEIDTFINMVKKPEYSQDIELQSFYGKISDWALSFPAALDEIEELYKEYYEQFQKIIGDIEKINKILLERLLTEGVKAIKQNVVSENNCPLCLQPKNKNELLKELETRIDELEHCKKEKLRLIDFRDTLRNILKEQGQKLNYYLLDKHSEIEENRELMGRIEQFKSHFENYSSQISMETSPSKQIKTPDELLIERTNLNRVTEICSRKIENLKASKKDDLKFDAHSKILLSREAYFRIKKLKKEKEILERQQESLQLIYIEFNKKLKEGLEFFLADFSNDINDLYQFMNPDEKVTDFKLIPMEKDDELVGMTLEFKFFDNLESPPHKYLSESHVNCLGIAFFLTSVKAFNKRNKFFILDDVISSFDSNHRKRFADLLIEKFSDYQILLFTHEKNWFEIVRHLVRGKSWEINTVKWNETNGTYIDEPVKNLKERIEKKVENGEVEGLGNDIRKYLEHILKQIAHHLEVKMKFCFNDKNEERMVGELLTDLRVRIKNTDLKENPTIKRLQQSVFFGNKDSHHNLFETSIGDLKAFWSDVKAFENLFLCSSCGKYVSFSKETGSRGKKISCKCGDRLY